MATNSNFSRVMEQTGFFNNGKPVVSVLDVDILRDKKYFDKRIKYDSILDPNKLNASAIFELSGSPCIYFRRFDQNEPDLPELARLHKLAWNHGLAPMMWVVTPTKVIIFNCYSKPTLEDERDLSSHVVGDFENTLEGLRKLNEFSGRIEIESGRFWSQEKARDINRRQRVDATLLEDLRVTEQKLVSEGLLPSIAHSILGRSIFIQYLCDRGILDETTFKNLFGTRKFVDALADNVLASRVFNWVKSTFNGDLFPLGRIHGKGNGESKLDENKHLSIVSDFLSGQEMKSGQKRLWPYSFDVIPIELISSIYEMFAHTESSVSADELSTHYTPINLVDLVLSQVFDNLPSDSRVADLSCGSGVFLVESLRRLIARKLADGETLSRKLIRNTLYNQIYGVDISKEAIQISSFSLYLTALELDPNPHPPHSLKFKPLRDSNLFTADAFDENAKFNKLKVFSRRKLGAIVGNPPWTRSKVSKLALEYCAKKNYPIAKGNPAQAFLWRIGDFTSKSTKIGLLLPGRPFFSHTAQALAAREGLLKRYRCLTFINLADLRQADLFPTSDAPAIAFIAESRLAKEGDVLSFVAPELSESFRRHGIIEIRPENIKQILTSQAATDPDLLKVASWGSARDMHLIRRLRDSFPTLGSIIVVNKKNGWQKGVGFKKGDESTVNIDEGLFKKKWLPAGALTKYQIDTSQLQLLPRQGFERPRKPELFRAPLLLVTRSLSREGFFAAFSEEDIVFPEAYFGISIPRDQSKFAHYLNGIFNSSVAKYFLFMTSSSWGIERDEVKPKDLERLPIPAINNGNIQVVEQIVAIEENIRNTKNSEGWRLQNALDALVYELYGLDENEIIFVEDGVKLTLDSRLKRSASIAYQPPSQKDLENYATQVNQVIQSFLVSLGERTIRASIYDSDLAPLQVVQFRMSSSAIKDVSIRTLKEVRLDSILTQMDEELSNQVSQQIHTYRALRIYVGKDLYVVKRAQRRYWSRSAGLNDSDEIIKEHLEIGSELNQ